MVYVVRIEATNNILPAISGQVNRFSQIISYFIEKAKKTLKQKHKFAFIDQLSVYCHMNTEKESSIFG
ncbi:hypothetical protein HMPREF9103_01700 [Lentilactobacillus parafarraginis F0439]|uniref:Uncharacterized protein n=1 Tax=Lentilactobacillus parafarraginis F0439 TaxID=797515 RepID=G9ZPP6_9LACO|nr:hypothetical protein HMPREF9103_01700 [Lentilactobacillus parafarraginis F0439]